MGEVRDMKFIYSGSIGLGYELNKIKKVMI